jgi:pimeloyl-ACP methyl ester carboxylesterase
MSDLFKVAGPDGEPSSSLILIHGLGGDHHDTWRCGAAEKPWNVDETFWPFWLARDRQELAIYVIGYRAPVSRLLGTAMHWTDQANSILARLLAEPALAQGPLIFIGHSLGGLMVKQLLRSADSTARYDVRAGGLIERVEKVAFLGTPHSGSGLASWGDRLRILVRPSAATTSLVRNDPNLRDLNNWYRDWANWRGIAHLILVEGRPTAILGMIVPPESADPGLANVRPAAMDATHVGICKPIDDTNEIYILLRDFVMRPFSARSRYPM